MLERYHSALDAPPDVRLLLLTHLNNKTGLMIPTAAIAEEALSRNVDVVVDAALSFGQVDLKAADIGADFIGFNLHMWIGAPVGVGVMYTCETGGLAAREIRGVDVLTPDDPRMVAAPPCGAAQRTSF